jgi:Zn-dependent protease
MTWNTDRTLIRTVDRRSAPRRRHFSDETGSGDVVNGTVRLGRIAGIPIGLHWSWAVVFALFAWSLGRNVFPSSNPGLGGVTYAVMALAATTLFFGSLLLHELGHTVVARREGVAIDGITLWLFGGVAQLGSPLPSARAELRLALGGPAVTALIVVVCTGVAQLGGVTSAAVDGVVSWLAYINLILLAFNLLPALPLDGGRVLRALLWRARGDFAWATSVAGAIGRVIGIAMIAAGFASMDFTGVFGGIWLALIGWFVFQAAGAEAATVSRRARRAGALRPNRPR